MAKHLPPPPTNGQNVRIECMGDRYASCGAQLDPTSLKEARALGWTKISRERSWKDAGTTYDDPREEPPGFSIFDWNTHFGVCPECSAEAAEEGHEDCP